MTDARRILGMAALLAVALSPAPLRAQAETPAGVPATAPARVRLSFPENVEIKVLVDYIGQRQGINFLYDEQIGGKRVTIKAPQEVPVDSLLTLVESALKMKGLAVVRTDVPGTLRIEPVRQLTTVSTGPTAAPTPGAGPTLAVTRVLQLQHARPQRVEQVIGPFLSVPTATVTSLPEHNLLVVTDYADNLKRLEDMVALVDRPGREVLVKFVPLLHVDAGPAAQQVTQLLAGKAKARDGGAPAVASSVTVLADERTNQLSVVGPAEEIGEVLALAASLDVALGTETRVYAFATASSEQVDRLVRNMLGPQTARRLYRSTPDHDSNVLVATTTPQIHKDIETLRQALDKPVSETQSPIRFYKLQNAKAIDVLETLRGIEGEGGLADVSIDGVAAAPEPRADSPLQGPTEAEVNQSPAPAPAPYAAPAATSLNGPIAPARRRKSAAGPGGARVMADEASNTLIVVARPSMHPVYEKLIRRLDVRRPQVLIEATVVTLDTTDGFSLGVEVSTTDKVNDGEATTINFSNFGLSTVNPTTGALTLKPGIGFNGALISAELANVILRALKSDTRAKVMARPSVLVNDNARGKIESKSEEPFSSVNASSTVSTTTFGGYAAAGTLIEVTPQISEGDHLKLTYEITLSSFGEGGSADLPPSRQSSSLKSEATIPNGYTIVVGGLNQDNYSRTVDRVPILGELPGLEYVFSNRTTSTRQSTLFVFIHAVILREDQFQGLKVLSADAVDRAGLPSDHPASEPVTIP